MGDTLEVYLLSQVAHLAALRCIDSILKMTVAVCGDQTVEAYFNWSKECFIGC